VGKNFNREQNTVCILLLISFVLGVTSIYFKKLGGIPIGKNAIYVGIAFVPLTFLYLRKFFDVLNAVALASVSGLTFGAGVGFVGLWYVFENPSRMWLGPKWLFIGGIFTACFLVALKALKTELPKEAISEEVIQNMTDLERLKHLEKSFSNEETFAPIKMSHYVPLGLVFVGIGFGLSILAIANAESLKERLIMIGILVVIVPLGAWFVIWRRRKTCGEFNAILADINEHRQEVLTKVRAEIHQLEDSETIQTGLAQSLEGNVRPAEDTVEKLDDSKHPE
jgi:uncharacterized membrane protein YqjE